MTNKLNYNKRLFKTQPLVMQYLKKRGLKILNVNLFIGFILYIVLYILLSHSFKFTEIYIYERFLAAIIFNVVCFGILSKYWKINTTLSFFLIISFAIIFIICLIFIRYQEIFTLIELPLKKNFRSRSIFAISFTIKYLALSILFYRYYLLKQQLNKIIEETIKIKDEELNYLALQANQHLIYNSLNMLYSKANNKSPYIGSLIMNLSKQIRKII